jgi:hypothetical protein
VNLLAVPMLAVVLASTANATEKPTEHQLKIEFDELAAKASAAIDTVNGMEQRARDDGQTLHSSLLIQRNLVQSTMDEAQESLSAKKLDQLQERLKRARAHIDRLYRMI